MSYVPKRGDLVKFNFNPQAGHEQAGWRPALVISPERYNAFGLALVCPITNQVKGFPFEALLPAGVPITGVVLSDQLKSVDWRARNIQCVSSVLPTYADFLQDVLARIETLVS